MDSPRKAKILFVSQHFPYPPDTDGVRRICYNFLRYLSSRYEITLLSYATPEDQVASAGLEYWCSRIVTVASPRLTVLRKFLSLFNLQPSNVSVWYTREMQAELDELLAQNRYDLVYADMLSMSRFLLGVSQPKIIAVHDALSLLYKRRSAYRRGIPRILLRWEEIRLRRWERNVLSNIDGCCVVSDIDRDYLERLGVPQAFTAVNGVDSPPSTLVITVDPDTVVFSGVMDYPPNEDAALFFCREIMPLLKRRRPDAKFVIAGRNPTTRLSSCSSEDITITGYVDNLANIVARGAVFVSPLRFGSGVKNKILEAMAMGKAVVGSSLSFEGIEDLREAALIADDPMVFADSVATLLAQPAYADKLGARARELVLSRYSWNKTFSVVAERIENLLNQRSP